MSAIKISGWKIFFPLLLLLIFSCSEKQVSDKKNAGVETLDYIVYSKVGGESGNYKTVKVTQDSVVLSFGNTLKNHHTTWKKALPDDVKEELFGKLKINQLSFIKSSESIQAQDGADETFQIKTSRTSYVFVNAYNDEYNYRQLRNFKTHLEKIIPKGFQPL